MDQQLFEAQNTFKEKKPNTAQWRAMRNAELNTAAAQPNAANRHERRKASAEARKAGGAKKKASRPQQGFRDDYPKARKTIRQQSEKIRDLLAEIEQLKKQLQPAA